MSRKKFVNAPRERQLRKRSGSNQTIQATFVSNISSTWVRFTLFSLVLAAALATGACSKKTKPRVAMTPRIGATESGIASWYGHPYHGRRAANGEVYDMDRHTAAHRTLPFETWVEVLNLSNQKRVTVRITDRGPFIDGRIIDLSRAAARDIDLIGPGITQVQIKIVAPPRIASAPPPPPAATAPPLPPPPPATAPELFAVQIGAFRDRTRAERLRDQYQQTYGAARIVLRAGDPPLWRVLVGREPSLEQANGLLQRIADGTGEPAFVVRLDESDPVVRANP
jgi:rare lipoprotein A